MSASKHSLDQPIIASRANARVKQLRAAFAGQARLSGGMTAIEGDHLLEEALRSGMVVKTCFVTESRAIPGILPHSIEILRLTEEVFASVVETQSPQGVAALIVPPVRELATAITGTPLLLVAAGLQDPGNMGTLIRSAEAFGASGVLTTPGTVSTWNQKALRASAGSVFRLPVVAINIEDLAKLKQRGIKLLAAVGSGHGISSSAHNTDLTAPCALLIGNEGTGLAPQWLNLCDAQITIPYSGPVESLNAAIAGSLLLYEASQQRASMGAK